MTDLFARAHERYAAGDLDGAERTCLAVVEADAHDAGAWCLLGLIAHRRGQAGVAADRMERALAAAPDQAEYLVPASEVFRSAGRSEAAVAAARQAARLRPELPAAWNNLGLALRDVGEAEAAFRHALELEPGYARAWLNLGSLLVREHRLTDAVACLQEALRLRPDYPQARNALGEAVRRQGRAEEAVGHFRHALRLRPRYPQALLNLGNALAALGRLDDAEARLREAVAVNGDYAAAHHDLGAVLERRGAVADAAAAYRRAYELQPDRPEFLAAWENARRRLCDWGGRGDNVPGLMAATRDALARARPGPLWPLASCRFPTTNEDRLGIARGFARQLARQVDPGRVPLHASRLTPRGGRLRIGFLGHEFGDHVVGHLMQGLFERFDRGRFEVIVFDHTPDDGGAIRGRIRSGCDRFLDVRPLTALGTAERIAREEIHILLDITSYMPGGRPEAAAWRPAPVQVSYMYPATTGARFIDYFLTDRVATPPGHERYFTESLVYLPDAYLPAGGNLELPAQCPGRDHWGLPASGFVFASFNAADKIDPETFDAWMRVLGRVPGSVLWQRDDGPTVRSNLRREAEARGIDPRRIVFAPKLPSVAEHLARHRHADLFLDAFGHGAHATAADALWAGLPLLTCPGDTFAGRVAASLLTAAGLPELIAAGRDDFERRAVRWAERPDQLQALRARVAAARASPLFDSGRLVRSLEWAFGEMWRRYEAREPPGSFAVPVPGVPAGGA